MRTRDLGVALCSLALAAAAPSVRAGEPSDVVARLERAIEGGFAGASFAERQSALAPVVADTHELEAIARELAGARWESAAEDERSALIEAAGSLASAIYAASFEGSAGAVFERSSAEEVERESAVVRSSFPSERGAPRRLEHRLARGPRGWRIVDFAEEGGGGFDELRAVTAAVAADAKLPVLAAELSRRAQRIAEPPAAVVARLQAALLAAMQRADELGFAGRRDLLAPVIADTHDLGGIAKLVVSTAWRNLDDEERLLLTDTFRELSVANYAARFDGYGGERFGAPQQEPAQKGLVLVKSVFTKSNGEPIHFDYQMRRAAGRWRILNILVEGVSDLALKKTEYGEIIEKQGFPALIAKLRGQIARYEAGEKD